MIRKMKVLLIAKKRRKAAIKAYNLAKLRNDLRKKSRKFRFK